MIKNKLFYGLIVLFFISLISMPDYNFALLNTGIYLTHGKTTIEDIKYIADKKQLPRL